MKQLLSILMLVVLFAACTEKKADNTAIIKLKIEGLAEECEFDVVKDADYENAQKLIIKNGITECRIDNVVEPSVISISCTEGGNQFFIRLFVEAGETYYEGKVVAWSNLSKLKRIEKIKINGFIANKHQSEWAAKRKELSDASKQNIKNMSPEEIQAAEEKVQVDNNNWQINWVKEHSNEWYSAYMVDNFLSKGVDAATHEKLLSYLDPKMDNKHVRSLKKKLKEMNSTDVKLEDLIKAKNVHYKVDKNYDGSHYKKVIYMSVINNNQIGILTKDGQFTIIDGNGKTLSSFKPETKGTAVSFAVNASNEIYALAPMYKTVVKKHRGRDIKKQVIEGVECVVLNAKGTEKKRFNFEGLASASGAKFMNDKLIVSDFEKATLHVFDSKTGKKTSEITDMRACCGILDFCIGENDQLLVADLGAFRVQGYKLNGDKILAFGKRGRGMDEFHGCCNPVNIGRLSNGAIVTVEKSPTRIKIYSQEGARLIDGVEELVKGCAYIPMAIDMNDNLYLASPDKGLVKCVAKS